MRTWFDRCIFDREWYRLLKPHHPRSTVPYVLPINEFLFFGSAIGLGAWIASLLT